MSKVFSLNFASVVATFTPKDSSVQPITFKADVFFNEGEMLSEPAANVERAKYFAANDGQTGQYVDIFAKSGKRDITLMDSLEAEKLIAWAMSNPQPLFDLSFYYKRNDQEASEARTQMHYDCKFLGHPARIPGNDSVVIKFSFNYANMDTLDASGNPISL